jgi:gas vesicle protein
MSHHDETPYIIIEKSGSGIGSFLLGTLIGAGVALLFAPRTGEETREEIRTGATKLRRQAEDTVRNVQGAVYDSLDKARSGVNDRIDQARDAFDAGRQAARETRVDVEERVREARERVRSGVDEARDRVRAGVEAARKPPAEHDPATETGIAD